MQFSVINNTYLATEYAILPSPPLPSSPLLSPPLLSSPPFLFNWFDVLMQKFCPINWHQVYDCKLILKTIIYYYLRTTMEGGSSNEKISLRDMTTYDDQLFNSGDKTERDDGSNSQCQCKFFSKRYMISILALLGFCNLYALRVNLSVALVAMVAKNTVKNAEGKMVEVWASQYQDLTGIADF